jgi:hypothetical protein
MIFGVATSWCVRLWCEFYAEDLMGHFDALTL